MTQELIRKALLVHPDGMTPSQIYKTTGLRSCNAKRICDTMADVYICRWDAGTRQGIGYTPVYMVVPVPKNAPRPV